MESVSRPPHRRKHSATTNAFSSSTFSFKNPYDGVLLSNGGERKSLEAHEYTEIFSGPSAIPVLDLSGLDERVGSDDPRSSKLDYSNIFGGLRNDDVAVPYHELFNGSAKKIKPRISSDTSSHLQKSSSLHSSGKTKTSSAEASDQSVDGVKQQFNLSFNRTSQRNSDAPNGKTHIAELHAVPGFTYFVDGGNPQLQKTENDRRAPSLKREVSRTWSFAANVEAVKGKGGLSPEKSHTPDNKSHNVNEVNLKSSFPSRTSDSKNPMKSSASNFSLEDASEKVVGESSPPFFGEEFDENSVAALSAAALKKAIDQAQESIRIAKMIMEKKKEGFQDGHKRRPKSRVKVLEKEAKIYRDAYGSEENNAKEQFEELNPGVTGNDGKSNQSLHHNEKFINAANVDMERVWENVGTAKEHGETFARGGKLFASDCSRSKTVYIDERVEVKNLEENVYAAETHREVSNNSSKETLEVVIFGDNKKGSNVVAEQVENSAEEAEQCEDTFDHAEGSENRVERVLDASHRTREQEKVVDEAGEKLRICQVDEVSDQRVNDVDDKGKCEKKFHDCEEMLNVEDLTVLRSKFDSFMDESCNRFVNRILEQEDMEKKSESVFESKEDGITHGIIYNEEGMMQEEAPICVESEEQVRDALEEEKNERKAHAFAEIGETEKKVNEAYEPEIDNKKQNHVHDGDGRNLPGQLEQNTSEYGEAEPIVMEAKKYADIKSAEELDNNLRTQIQESADKDDIDEAIDVNSSGASTIFNDTHTTDASPILNTNEAEQYQKAVKNYKENDTSPDIIGTFAATDKDYESEQPSHLQDNEMPGRDALNRSASGEIFVESVGNAFEGLSVDGKIANTEEKPAEDDNAFKTTSKTHDASQEYDAKIVKQNLPEVHASDIGTAEFDLKDVRKVLEQTSETNEESLSNSNLENIDGLSAHEPEECAENAEDKTSNEEGLEDEIEMVSNERKCDEEQSVESYPHLHTEPKETEKSTEAARAAERDLNMEKNKEDLLANERNDHLQRIEAIKKGREREKDRLVVERAIREARERAFAEARERAERAAVEKAAAEVRQRVLAEAREKFEKSSVKQTVDKASTEAKRRAERAAVERATAEARSRALEKAMSQKTYTEARTPSSSGSNGLKHSFSSSDLENGANTESAQRRKARLERHQRIMERAAKALEEKNMRDLLVQKEQAERDRLSESLNADIKRWAAGKEGNLRALLSTLQYILGPDSSWQPISLTEIITTAAVKKAYRKATLYVHPDKLQQRGATIQQKYICEKVFDLLKAAWNRFNSDER